MAERSTRLTCSDACRQRRSRRLRASTPEFPTGEFDLILADPPLSNSVFRAASPANARIVPYATMDLAAICRLPIAKLAAPDSVLAIWVDGSSVETTLQVIQSWGFMRTLEGFMWVKLDKTGSPGFGLGQSTRKGAENLWIARRGRGLTRQDKGVAQVIAAQRREHSRKPDDAYVGLERLYGDVRRIELFARRARPGWERWGNELLPSDPEPSLPFIAEQMFEELRE
jgi:N6-adenosine-specific RNA methylase IME4